MKLFLLTIITISFIIFITFSSATELNETDIYNVSIVTSGYFIGNGSLLTDIDGSNYDDTDLWTNASVQESRINTNSGSIVDLWTNASVQESRINDLEAGAVSDVWVNESGDTMTGKLTIEDDLNVTGNIYLGGDILGANADVAEQFNVFQVVEPGDVVVAYKKVMLQISAQPYDNRVVGVVSTNPFMTLGISRKGTPIVMAGTAPTKVCDEGGEIKAGDLLTTSSRKGYAMKLELLDVTKARTFSELKQMIRENDIRRMGAFGKALEDFDDNSGKITAIINLM